MRKILIVLSVAYFLLLFYPKKSTYWHNSLYYKIYDGSGLDNYGQKCKCYGVEEDRSTMLETVYYCYGIPVCHGNI